MKISSLAFAALFSLAAACSQRSSAEPVRQNAAPPVAAATQPAATDPPMIPVGTKLKCPVTGEDFTVKAATVQVVYKGKRYAFCCPDCKPDFEKNPDKFAKN